MPRTCTVCKNDELVTIQKLVAEGVSLSEVSSRFSVTKSALSRHFARHVPRGNTSSTPRVRLRSQTTHQGERDQTRFDSPVDPEAELARAMNDVSDVMDAARASGDVRLQILAARELRPLVDSWFKAREKAKGEQDDVRVQALRVLSQLPESFLRALQDGDSEVLDALETAVQIEQTSPEGDNTPNESAIC